MEALYEKIGYEYLEKMDISYKNLWTAACATPSQIAYLIGAIKDHRFENGDKVKRVLEIGVANGLSSLYMLKAGVDTEDFILYGIDILKSAGRDVYNNANAEELKKWRMNIEKTSFNIEEILNGEKLDMVFIDGMHAHPAALIDFIMVYPHLRKDALVILHDVETYLDPSELGACYFYTAWNGEKRLNYNVHSLYTENKVTEYMGIISIDREEKAIFNDLLVIAMQPITGAFYSFGRQGDPLGLEIEDIDVVMRSYMERYYQDSFTDQILKILIDNLADYKSKWIYYKHWNRLFDPNRFHGDNILRGTTYNQVLDYFKNGMCAIWGAGYQGSKLVKEIMDNNLLNKISVWCDSNITSALVSSPLQLNSYSFDYIIIAIESRKAYENVKKTIIEMGIAEEKIVWEFEKK